jgi:predicted glutamine amidotransferase
LGDEMARLVGFIANRPDLCNRFAATERRVLSTRNQQGLPWGWGVGFFQSADVLLKRRPLDERRELALADMITDVRSDLLVTHVRRATVGALRTANTHPFRYRHWLFAQTGTLDGFGQLQHRLYESLPSFLQRSVRGETDGEHLFHLFLSFLHDAGRLDSLVVPPEECCAALRATLALVERMGREEGRDSSPVNLLLACPDYLVAVRAGAPMGYRVLQGRADFEPLYDEQGPEKLLMPDLEPCRLAAVASDFDGDAVPEGWTEVGPDAIVVFTRTDVPTTVRAS